VREGKKCMQHKLREGRWCLGARSAELKVVGKKKKLEIERGRASIYRPKARSPEGP